MSNYFRITGYVPEQNICFIMDSNGMFEKLWQFSSFVIQHGCKVLEISTDDKFVDINMTKATAKKERFFLRACYEGKPRYFDKVIEGVTYKAVEVEGKQYIPER